MVVAAAAEMALSHPAKPVNFAAVRALRSARRSPVADELLARRR